VTVHLPVLIPERAIPGKVGTLNPGKWQGVKLNDLSATLFLKVFQVLFAIFKTHLTKIQLCQTISWNPLPGGTWALAAGSIVRMVVFGA
jgi:hypothetical protein